MSFTQKAASFAVALSALVGLGFSSSAGQAAELARVALAPPAILALNEAPVASVPMGPSVPVVQPLPAETPAVEPAVAVAPANTDFRTLDAAVAAQSTSAADDEQLRCLAASIYFESKGEPLAGQLAVAEVILNRAKAKRFGSSVCGVVTQPGQFSFVRGGQVPTVDADRPAYRTALAVARVAMADAWDSGADEALYFHARRLSPGWKRTRIASIGNHVFYR